MGLFGPAWDVDHFCNEKKLKKALAAVEKADAKQLVKIAIKSANPSVSERACERLYDEGLAGDTEFCQIAREGQCVEPRIAAASHLEDPALLESLTDEMYDDKLRSQQIILAGIGANPTASPELLKKIVALGDSYINDFVRDNPSTPPDLRIRLTLTPLESLARDASTLYLGKDRTSAWSSLHKKLEGKSKDELLELACATQSTYLKDSIWDEFERFGAEHGVGSKDELAEIAQDPHSPYRRRVCSVLGHVYGDRCVCTRCGQRSPSLHSFDTDWNRRVGSTCTRCGGRIISMDINRNPFNDEQYEDFVIEYPDGVQERWVENDDAPGGWVVT